MLGFRDPDRSHSKWFPINTPTPERPNPSFEYYIDHCVFFGSQPIPLEHYSDDFEIVGYMGQWQLQEQCTLAETHSNPGYLTLTLLGAGLGTCFSPVGGADFDLEPDIFVEHFF